MECFNFLEIINLSLLLQIVLVCSKSDTSWENNPGYCRNAEGNRVCCAMYYVVDKKCVECPKGTSRLDSDSDCVTCIVGYFGRLCAQKCACREDQRCDAVQGCVCRNRQDGCKQETPTDNDTPDTRSPQNIQTESDQKHGINISTLLYGVFIGVLCSVAIVAVFRLILKQRRNNASNRIVSDYEFSVSRPISSRSNGDGHYQSIDPVVVAGVGVLSGTVAAGNSKDEDTGSNSIVSQNNGKHNVVDGGYLTPFQPFIQN